MTEHLSKIAIGTAQFGMNYGINNKTGQVSLAEIKKILDTAWIHSIRTLDTSYYYGSSEERIGEYLACTTNRFAIVSKLPDCDSDTLESYLDESLRRLKVDSIDGYLIHHFEAYEKDPALFSELISFKEKGKIRKAGFSLYHPWQLERLLDDEIPFDLVQVPFNVLDQRFWPYFGELKNREIEIHVRSIYLQGLLLMDDKEILQKFPSLEKKLDQLSSINHSYNIAKQELLSGFAFSNPFINKIIIGFDKLEHLLQLLHSKMLTPGAYYSTDWKSLKEENEDIILPVNWK